VEDANLAVVPSAESTPPLRLPVSTPSLTASSRKSAVEWERRQQFSWSARARTQFLGSSPPHNLMTGL
jgi:hypothetical protein